MRPSLREKAISVCDDKISKKGEGVGLSFYAFFANKNDDPDLLMPPSSVAESYGLLYQQPKSAWTFELEIRPFGEKW